MFNLNTPTSLLGIDGCGLSSTPKTPEIVNSLIAMTNPMDNYNFTTLHNGSAASTPGSAASLRGFNGAPNAQIISQDSSHSSSSTSPVDSPGGTNTTPPSVQQTCSQLIKAGLKLSIQSKRKLSTCDSSSGSDQPNCKYSRPDEDVEDSSDEENECKATPKGLTPEDEDRRRRRRERNKIAATKCRMKKRERTQNLIKESEQLETQNVDLKTQVRTLEAERRKLLDMLQCHVITCVHAGGLNLPSKLLLSPAHKYLAALDIDDSRTINGDSTPTSGTTSGTQSQTQQQIQSSRSLSNRSALEVQRTAIPPMSTIKFSRTAAAVAAAVNQQLHQLPTQQQHLPNGYCKPSPTPQELGYLASPSQESICLPAILPQLPSQTLTTHQIGAANASSASVPSINQQLSDYIPSCENSLGLVLAHTPTSVQSNDDNSVLLGDMVSPLSVMSTPTTATEFVKNELVDSQSPYTTAQSAERFLFESNCDSFVDTSLHHGSLNNNNNSNNSIVALHQNSNSNLLDFNTSLIGGSSGIVPFHDQISIKNDYLHDADLLAQFTGDGADFVDLDSSVAATFMANNGCLA